MTYEHVSRVSLSTPDHAGRDEERAILATRLRRLIVACIRDGRIAAIEINAIHEEQRRTLKAAVFQQLAQLQRAKQRRGSRAYHVEEAELTRALQALENQYARVLLVSKRVEKPDVAINQLDDPQPWRPATVAFNRFREWKGEAMIIDIPPGIIDDLVIPKDQPPPDTAVLTFSVEDLKTYADQIVAAGVTAHFVYRGQQYVFSGIEPGEALTGSVTYPGNHEAPLDVPHMGIVVATIEQILLR